MSRLKIALFGSHRFAVEVARYLDAEAYEILIADKDEENLAQARELGLRAVKVDYLNDTELKALGLGRDINAIFSLFPDDADNVFLTISARALDPKLHIVTLAETVDSIPKLSTAGANRIINPYDISARKIWELVKRPIISDVMDHTLFGKADLNLAEVEVVAGSFLDQKHIRDIDFSDRYNLIILGVADVELGEELIFTTKGFNHKLDPGDILVVIGPTEDIDQLKEDLATRTSARKRKRFRT